MFDTFNRKKRIQVFFFFFLTLYWGKNAIMIEFTRRHIIREIKVINYSYKNNYKQLLISKRASANGTLDPCKAPPCCYLQLQFQCC